MRCKWLSGLCGFVLLGLVVSSQASPPAERMRLELAGVPFDVEYVAEPGSRRQGLMGREHLPRTTGMLFDFPEGTQPAIWMRNMLISLDLLYINAEGRVAQIFANVPPCEAMPCEVYHAQEPLRFVLEVPAGTADRLGLSVGQQLNLGELAEQPPPAE